MASGNPTSTCIPRVDGQSTDPRVWGVREFEVGDHVFLKVMPKKEVVSFSKRGKLSPRFVGPFEILERIGCCVPVGFTAQHVRCPRGISRLHASKVYSGSSSCGGLGTD